MNSQSAMPMTSTTLSSRVAQRARRQLSIAGMSGGGVVLFFMGLLVVGSGFASLRPEVMGLRFHPYLVPMAMALPFVLMARIGEFPVRVLAAMAVFMGMYTFSVFNGRTFEFGELFKVATTVMTILTSALLVRRRGDMVAGSLGLAIAVAVLAANALQDPTMEGGVEAMEGANKNSYSVYALPAILLAGYIALRMPTTPLVVKSALICCAIPSLVAIFMSGNRSGYLGAAVIGVMLFRDRRLKGLLLVGAVAVAVIFWISEYGSSEVFDEKMKQTVEGYGGDEIRKEIFNACIKIGLENPIIGVSPQQLPYEIGRRMPATHRLAYLDPHNAFAHVFAASGMLCFAALIAVGWTMYHWKPRDGRKIAKRGDPLGDAVRLLKMMVILWAARGVFTRDILYNPSFSIGLGLAIGLCMLAEVARQEMSTPAGKPLPAGRPLELALAQKRIPPPGRA